MENKEESTERSQRIRQTMQAHVASRLAKALAKWDGKNDAMARQAIVAAHEKYQLAAILEKGRKANGMTIATHITKGIHPDLKIKHTTNLAVCFEELPTLDELGSHVLNSQESLADATGTAPTTPPLMSFTFCWTARWKARHWERSCSRVTLMR